DALQMAIKDYENRKSGVAPIIPSMKDIHDHGSKDGQCYCPYCIKKENRKSRKQKRPKGKNPSGLYFNI
ncbi:hypothetical protein QUF76_18385, partial [Desulfobacterales bacterium HSG16]|nr:hypothetical protein [Desulfobacterales bacterium HSG16]